jgi:hypothetical protein
MARGYSRSSSGRRSSSRSSRSSHTKSYNNSTRQTCAQRYSPTKVGKTWYDAGGDKVKDTSSYFGTISKNGEYWKGC